MTEVIAQNKVAPFYGPRCRSYVFSWANSDVWVYMDLIVRRASSIV